MEPGGPVTLEIHAPDGEVFTFRASSELDAIDLAFPPEPPLPPPSIFD